MRLGIMVRRREPRLCNADNLHRIAISNLQDSERELRRWWHKKYRIPPKPIDDYTEEELYLEHLEDYYATHPKAVKDFLRRAAVVHEWNGELPPEVERENLRRLARIQAKRPVDISKYQTAGDKDLTDDDVAKILAAVGRDLPGSRRLVREGVSQPVILGGPVLGDGSMEFEESFEE